MKSKLFLFLLLNLSSIILNSQIWSEYDRMGMTLSEIHERVEEQFKSLPSDQLQSHQKWYQRWRYERSFYGDLSLDQIIQKNIEKRNFISKESKKLQAQSRSAYGEWENVMPDSLFTSAPGYYPHYGVVYDIAFDLEDSNLLYAGTHGAGLWRRSSDGTWKQMTFGLPIQGVMGIVAKGDSITILTGSK